MLRTQRRGVIPTPEVHSYTVNKNMEKKVQRIAACACAVTAHAAIIVGAFTAIEFMLLVLLNLSKHYDLLLCGIDFII